MCHLRTTAYAQKVFKTIKQLFYQYFMHDSVITVLQLAVLAMVQDDE